MKEAKLHLKQMMCFRGVERLGVPPHTDTVVGFYLPVSSMASWDVVFWDSLFQLHVS